ncbi:MAG: pyridoxamine 5'-phosphate oxidase family protein [Candidatus Sphingomonas phytovorans]|nr:pyridoxamine 5'-phosphate oxidase family protein [Sphingomonas sp.]WEK00726.1 MAG: pyridoxamine 5'-phosphate oxidase family protein [Sphingomonas sp.]
MKDIAMPDTQDITAKFWKALRSDRTVMLGLDGVEDGRAQPMTAQLDGDEDRGPIWFFTSKETDLARELREGRASRALAHFASKGHDLFASIHGTLSLSDDRAVIDRLWNPFVAAWFEGGKDDPKLQLLRLDPERAQIWLNGSSLLAGVKTLLGVDPKQDYRDKVAEVSLA